MRFSRLCMVLCLGAFLPWQLAMAVEKPVPPDAAKEVELRKLVHEAYKDEFAKPKQADQLALANQLISAAADPSTVDQERYVLLCEGRDLAVKAGDVTLASTACDAIEKHFLVDHIALRRAMLEQAGGFLYGEVDTSIYVVTVLQTVDDALRLDDFANATALQKLAATAVPKAKNAKLSNLVQSRLRDIDRQKAELAKVKPAADTLVAHPADPAANLAVGEYNCFIKGDWNTGLSQLAAGSDAKIASVAKQDLADPVQPEAKLAIADGWYDLIKPQGNSPHIQTRALDWYKRAAPDFNGVQQKKIETRVAELESAALSRWSWGQIWATIRLTLQRKTYETSEMAGGAFGKETLFEQIPPTGVILVGFRITAERPGYVSSLQPIWLTPNGEAGGQVEGKTFPDATVLRARPGYAVGQVVTRNGANIDGIRLVYMRIGEKSLITADSYSSDPYGTKEKSDTYYGGDGSPIIGISGNIQHNGQISGLRIITAPVNPNASDPTNPKAGDPGNYKAKASEKKKMKR